MKQELFCINGQHKWEREAKRGRKPLNCPEHSEVIGADPGIEVGGAVSMKPSDALEKARAVKAQKAQELELETQKRAQESLVTMQGRVEAAIKSDEKAYRHYKSKGTPKTFHEWLKVNSRLLGETAALRALEKRLGEEI